MLNDNNLGKSTILKVTLCRFIQQTVNAAVFQTKEYLVFILTVVLGWGGQLPKFAC